MRTLDWIVLIGTIAFITAFGIWKSRKHRSDVENYLFPKKMNWWTIGLSIAATQASAITFLSTPGQGFSDGMRFVQFYFGLPLAVIVLSITFVPIFQKLKVRTAYEYLENRFDLKTRSLCTFLFLTQRGLAAGLTLYAPSLILSTILNWDISWTNLSIGVVVLTYTFLGGTTAVSETQKQQLFVVFLGMITAGVILVQMLPAEVSFGTAVSLAGKMGKLNVIDTNFDWNNRYTLWSGLIGGFFVSMSYFGTDQSQVQRYLGGKSTAESRLGLIFNGFIKIPMQFLILLLGTLVFVFYQFNSSPIFFNQVEVQKIYQSADSLKFKQLEQQYEVLLAQKSIHAGELARALDVKDEALIAQTQSAFQDVEKQAQSVRKEAIEIIHEYNVAEGRQKATDTNYIFLTFVINYLPQGIVGLLIAVIFCASMSASASELNALASTFMVDIYQRNIKKNGTGKHYLRVSKLAMVGWCVYAILFAEFANSLSGNLIEAVNILGSLFYGTILGIFLVAFYFKTVRGDAVFVGAILAEAAVIWCWQNTSISFLWYNVIGCVLVILISLLMNLFVANKAHHS
ncbi:sodium:solute symporter [Thermoflexibacter ruber]|uniref:Transporter, SSS family n=1 Tax=Thermoflexibacter ruber TaxID=1003 RepID=A0A1I2B2P7_9BACT|nr:sodium:solute symporter [Thermoflexibacter ruber]SFE50462.1 transporter, SSS family [Thermoflexibacter ruber]